MVKDEARNPNRLFKARGMTWRSRRQALGARPCARLGGNAAGAWPPTARAPGCRGGAMPDDTPRPFIASAAPGCRVQLVAGTIADAAIGCASTATGTPSTCRPEEPFRVEARRRWPTSRRADARAARRHRLSTGGGTGLVGMWKAFDEMALLGWRAPMRRGRGWSRAAAGCAPVWKVRRRRRGDRALARAATRAWGLRVPRRSRLPVSARAAGDPRTAVTVDERRSPGTRRSPAEGLESARGRRGLARPGRPAAAGGSAARAVVVFNTGTGLKYR